MHVQTSLIATAELYAQAVLGIAESDVVFSAAKLFFAYGLGNALTFPLAVGATGVLYAGRVTPGVVSDVLRRARARRSSAACRRCSARCSCTRACRRARSSRCACAPRPARCCPKRSGERWTQRTGVEIIDGIGSTEMLHIFVSNRPGAVRYGTTGQPVPGYRARHRRRARRRVRAGRDRRAGSLRPDRGGVLLERRARNRAARSPASGRAPATSSAIDENGDYVYCGRADDMLKVGGIWVSPSEVESALVAHEHVLECAVVGAADESELIKPKAFVVLKPGLAGDDALCDALKAHVKSRLAPYKYPRWIEFVDELPKTATGKIQRHVLRAREAAARA